VKALLEGEFGEIWVEGEVSNFRRYESGHCYFTLKDAQAQLSCVMWRGIAAALKFAPADGRQVVARGKLSVYEPRGQYQLVVEWLEQAGLGALWAAFEALKAKLAAEGLFDPARKRPLPAYPRTIALVTSSSGAAIRDLFKVILGRWPKLALLVVPVRVQGEGAAQEIAAGIELVNRHGQADVMIVGRGGGSLEDLWAFNEEIVARAIAASHIPVISAVGHEIDFTISDFVADVRAATPSHAGEIVVPELAAVVEQLERLRTALPEALLARLELARERLRSLAGSWALRAPEERLQQQRQRLDDLQARLEPLARRLCETRAERLAGIAARLEGLSPLRVLERGYSVTERARDGAIVKSADAVKEGELVRTRLWRGRLVSRVENTET
jgi:exodeoxyribonuclease VII large subunit